MDKAPTGTQGTLALIHAGVLEAWNGIFGSRKSANDTQDINGDSAPWKRELLEAARKFNQLPKAERDELNNNGQRIAYDKYFAKPLDTFVAADLAHLPQALLEEAHFACKGMKWLPCRMRSAFLTGVMWP